MGFNGDNVFVNTTDINTLLGSVSRMFEGEKWKMAISEPQEGWVHIIDSHENTPPEFTRKLSKCLGCLSVCAQLYETAGEIAWAIFEKGVELEAVHRKAPHDPGGEIKDVLLRSGVPFEMSLFREVVCQKQGWSIKQSQR